MMKSTEEIGKVSSRPEIEILNELKKIRCLLEELKDQFKAQFRVLDVVRPSQPDKPFS